MSSRDQTPPMARSRFAARSRARPMGGLLLAALAAVAGQGAHQDGHGGESGKQQAAHRPGPAPRGEPASRHRGCLIA